MHACIAAALSGDEDFQRALSGPGGGYRALAEQLIPGWSMPRSLAKHVVVLAWLNGSTPHQLAVRLGVEQRRGETRKSIDEKKVLREQMTRKAGAEELSLELLESGDKAFRATFPTLSRWVSSLVHEVSEGRTCTVGLPTGEKVVVNLRDGKAKRKIVAAVLLTFETRIIARVENQMEWECLDMHDGFLLAIPEDQAEAEATRIAGLLRDSAAIDGVELKIKVGLGDTWGEAEESAEIVDLSDSGGCDPVPHASLE